MSSTAVEHLDFVAHPHILFSIMQSQAGTLAKALLEGIMNSIDAGASYVSIEITDAKFIVRDNGRGFQSKDEVLNWFGQFGTPHEEGDATYGKFRMGRGQLMAFAQNAWRTGPFLMEVDIKSKGLTYELSENLSVLKGCTITGQLYATMTPAEIDEVLTELKELAQFAQIPVKVNGKLLSKPLDSIKWDAETEDGYFKLQRTGNLLVYNLGVLVRSFDQYNFGCGGIIVTKTPLIVNFARNDILTHQCTTWKRISTHLKRTNVAKITQKSFLNDQERRFLSRQWSYGHIVPKDFENFESWKVFTDASGKHHSLQSLREHAVITSATENQARTGARLQREGKAFVVSEETLQRFGVSSVVDLIELLFEGLEVPPRFTYVKFEELALGCTETYQVLEPSDLPLEEQLLFNVLLSKHGKFFKWFSSGEIHSGQRELRPGVSDVAQAWTDGASYIIIDRHIIQKAIKKGESGFFELLLLLVHEYCHDSADLESHAHDIVFYSKFHDIVQYRGGRLIELARELTALFKKQATKAGFSSLAADGAQRRTVQLTLASPVPLTLLDTTRIAACDQLALF
jgi:hypothetical protein